MTPNLDFLGHGVIHRPRPIDALNVLCAQLTRGLFAIAKFLLFSGKFVLYKPSLDEPTD